MENCIFCKIANKEISGKIVYEDDICLAFLDLSQTTDGHTLVIPKTHYKNILEVDDKTLIHLMTVTKQLANMIVTSLNAKGVNILTNANEAAGQTVMHFHIHIIPRYNHNDQIAINFTDRSTEVNLDDILNKIKAEMN
ncbi:MAG: HIT family protein [Thomasclavelia sp.]|uniref:HIT family protein n=1 Tax=Thomasclavelia sp. TaxID=3025757 RepID=UPI00399F01D7